MIPKLQKYLIRIFCTFTSILLLLILVIVMLFNERWLEQSNQRSFDTLFFTILNKLQTEDSVSDLWINSLEDEYQSLLVIDNNGQYLEPTESNTSPEHLTNLIHSLRVHAKHEGFSLQTRPGFQTYRKTEIYNLKDENGTRFYSCGAILQQERGYRAFYLFIPRGSAIWLPLLFLCMVLGVISLLAVRLLSRFLVNKALQSVVHGQEEQQEFIAAASHELRSPLSVIRSNNSYCKSDVDCNRRLVIEAECVRMSRLISDLLVLARPDSDSWSVKLQPVNVDTLIATLYDNYYLAAEEHQMPLSLHLPEETIPDILGDKERILQLLSIIIDNAFAYSSPGSPLEIHLNATRKQLAISIVDHGPGIADVDKDKVFTRFFRVDEARHDKEHFGLGLSIAKQLAEMQQGTLTLSDTPDGGATFTLMLFYA